MIWRHRRCRLLASSDNSLLVSNYSDTSCSERAESQFRISGKYNGQCFVVGNDEEFVEDDKMRKDAQKLDENGEETYVYIMRWQCNEFEDECDEKGIEIMDSSRLPQQCSSECVENERKQESESNKGRTSNDEQRKNDDEQKHKVLGVVVAVIVIVIVFGAVIGGSVFYGRKKAIQRENERNIAGSVNMQQSKQKKLIQADDKYEAFVAEQHNIVHLEDVNEANYEMPNNTVQ